ncbi:MAG TPA: hypothetical protein VGE80_17740, partial [Schlesneria sp.]
MTRRRTSADTSSRTRITGPPGHSISIIGLVVINGDDSPTISTAINPALLEQGIPSVRRPHQQSFAAANNETRLQRDHDDDSTNGSSNLPPTAAPDDPANTPPSKHADSNHETFSTPHSRKGKPKPSQ